MDWQKDRIWASKPWIRPLEERCYQWVSSPRLDSTEVGTAICDQLCWFRKTLRLTGTPCRVFRIVNLVSEKVRSPARRAAENLRLTADRRDESPRFMTSALASGIANLRLEVAFVVYSIVRRIRDKSQHHGSIISQNLPNSWH